MIGRLGDEEILLRRIHPTNMRGEGGTRPSSNAFEDSGDGSPMSVYVESIILRLGYQPIDVLSGYPSHGLVSFTVGLIRELDWDAILRGGTPGDPFGDAHSAVVGDKSPRPPRKRLALECDIRHWPSTNGIAT